MVEQGKREPWFFIHVGLLQFELPCANCGHVLLEANADPAKNLLYCPKCRASERLSHGILRMPKPHGLEESKIENGWRLRCRQWVRFGYGLLAVASLMVVLTLLFPDAGWARDRSGAFWMLVFAPMLALAGALSTFGVCEFRMRAGTLSFENTFWGIGTTRQIPWNGLGGATFRGVTDMYAAWSLAAMGSVLTEIRRSGPDYELSFYNRAWTTRHKLFLGALLIERWRQDQGYAEN